MPRKTGLGRGLPSEPERVGKGHAARYGYVPPEPTPPPVKRPVYKYKGNIKGWETTEICTDDPEEVNHFLAGMDPRTRVWLSATGTVYVYPNKPGGRIIARGTPDQTTSLTDNVPLYHLEHPAMKARIAKERKIFQNPITKQYEIDSYCIRVKEPL